MCADPHARQEGPIDPKNMRTISLLSCLNKTTDKILTQRVTWAAKLTRAISPDYFGSRAGLSEIDTLMTTSPPQRNGYLNHPSDTGVTLYGKAIRPQKIIHSLLG